MLKDTKLLLVDGLPMTMADVGTSAVRELVRQDLKDDIYGLRRIPWETGARVIDIGANIGMVSIYLALLHPDIKIFALEPMPENFDSLVANIRLNHVQDVVQPSNSAVTCDGRQFEMIAHLASNTGGATGFLRDMNLPEHQKALVESTTLRDIFRYCVPDRCRLLKIDCEGAEHEIIKSAGELLESVDYLSAELHINSRLESMGFSIEGTMEILRRFIPEDHLKIHTVHMAS